MTMKDEFMEKKREEGRVRGRERERAHYSKRCKDTWTQETETDKSRECHKGLIYAVPQADGPEPFSAVHLLSLCLCDSLCGS